MVHYHTSKCFILKGKIQTLVDAGVLTLKSEQKKITANMVTQTFPKVNVQDRIAPAPEARMEVFNPLAKKPKVSSLRQ